MADRSLEGGYTSDYSDTRHLEKLAEKQNQHRKLVGALELRGFDVKPMIFAFGVGGTIYKQSVEDMRQPGVSTSDHKNFEGSTSAFCHLCNQHHHPTQNIGQPEASTDAETATLDHHSHNLAFSQGLAKSVSLLIDSVTNA